jgi:glycosyltransferase involved in cell wall biosynthesis
MAKEINLKLSIIIPAYNEEKRIGNRLQSLVKYFNRLGEYELIVIMDGCTDRTYQIVSQHAINNSAVRMLHFKHRLGKGGALIKAFELARGDLLLITDADDSISPKELFKLVKEADNCDLVIGSRYARESRLAEEPFLRFFLGRSFNVIIKLMFWRLRKIKDTQCGAKVVKKSAIREVKKDLFITGFAFDVNLIYSIMRRNFIVKEVGIAWKHVERESKVSSALMKPIIGMFFSLLKLRIYYSRFRPVLETRIARKLSGFIWDLTKA